MKTYKDTICVHKNTQAYLYELNVEMKTFSNLIWYSWSRFSFYHLLSSSFSFFLFFSFFSFCTHIACIFTAYIYVNVTRKITLLWAPLKDERNVRKTNNFYIPFVKFSPLSLFFLYMSIFITLFHTFSFLFHIYFMFFFPLIVPSSFNRKYFMYANSGKRARK